jgi:hypothetical protein
VSGFVTRKSHPWMFAYPDSRNERIRELEAENHMLREVLIVAKAQLAKWEKKKKGRK